MKKKTYPFMILIIFYNKIIYLNIINLSIITQVKAMLFNKLIKLKIKIHIF